MRLTDILPFRVARFAAARALPVLLAATAILPAVTPPAAATAVTPLERTIFRARDRVFPALVHIQPILEVYQAGQKGRIAVTGSGVIISSEGYVLTNNHVVERAERVTCTLSDKQEIPATLVGRDPETDVAVIRLDLSHLKGRLPVAELGDSSKLQIGQQVMAMGSPLGLARSISLGIISSLDRYLPENQMPAGAATGQFNTWIQTDAAINPGNSGGPLVDMEGRVIGINARAVTVFGENVGFAIPIDIVREVAGQIIEFGAPRRSWLGANWQPALPSGEPGDTAGPGARGVLIGGVAPNSPAEKAGLRAGDVLVAFDGRPVTVRHEEELPPFRKLEADTPVGKAVRLSVLREDRVIDLTAVTAERKTAEAEDFDCAEWGFTVRAINEEIARSRNLEQTAGVIVTGVRRGSFAAEAEVSPGQVIDSVEGAEIGDLPAFIRSYNDLVAARTDRVLIVSRRGSILHFHLLRPSYEKPSAAGFADEGGMEGEYEEGDEEDGGGPDG